MKIIAGTVIIDAVPIVDGSVTIGGQIVECIKLMNH